MPRAERGGASTGVGDLPPIEKEGANGGRGDAIPKRPPGDGEQEGAVDAAGIGDQAAAESAECSPRGARAANLQTSIAPPDQIIIYQRLSLQYRPCRERINIRRGHRPAGDAPVLVIERLAARRRGGPQRRQGDVRPHDRPRRRGRGRNPSMSGEPGAGGALRLVSPGRTASPHPARPSAPAAAATGST